MTAHTDRESARRLLEQLAHHSLEKKPSSAPVLPPVSQPFINEDDAAYWLHQHERPVDREYGALVLQRADGRFVATTPIHGEAMSFDFERLLDFDPLTQVISHPAGYRCVGIWHTHLDIHAKVAKANPTFNEAQVRLFNALPSMPDVHGAFSYRDFFKHNYVSGPRGSLLAYSINPPDSPYSPVSRMGRTPEDMVRRIAAIGHIRILDPGTLWDGWRGPITAQWIPYQPATPGPPVIQPLFTGIFQDPVSALSDALLRVPAIPEHLRMGFILKHRDRDEYVATVPLQRADGLLAIEQVFPAVAGGFLLPADQTLAGVYLGPELLGTRLPPEQSEMYRQFFSPRSLLFSLQQGKTSGLVDSSRGFCVFRQTPDGALLKYHSTFSSAEAMMFEADGSMGANIDRYLLEGRMTARFFVRRVTAMGTLTVEKTSPYWDVAGPVGKAWRPYG